jgi:hypothetical protein
MDKPIKKGGVQPVVRYAVAQSFLKGEVRTFSNGSQLLKTSEIFVSDVLLCIAGPTAARVSQH